MLAISHSDSTLLVLEIEKSLLGKLIIKSGGKETLQKDSKLEEKLIKITKNKHAAFAIPDSKVYIFRFEISNDIKHDALHNSVISKVKEITHISPDHLLYDYFLLKTDENSQHVLFVASLTDVLSPYYELSKKADAKSLMVVPVSLAIFEILKHSIEKDETILYIDSAENTSTLTFFDSHGPVLNVQEPIEHTVLIDEIQKALTTFKEKYNRHITTIVLGGEKNELVDRENIAAVTGIEAIRSDTIFHDALLDLGVTFNEENPHIYLDALGLGIFSFKKESLNLAKKENLSRLNHNSYKTQEKAEYYPTHTNSNLIFSKKNIVLFVIFLILIPLMLFAYSEIKSIKKIDVKEEPAQKIQPTLAPTPTLNRREISLQVQNGNGQTGLAGKTADTLKKKGYSQVDTKNADSYSYKGVTLKIKESKKQYKDLLVSDLKDDYSPNPDIQELDKDSKYDAVVIIGK